MSVLRVVFLSLVILPLNGISLAQWIKVDTINTEYGFILLERGTEPVVDFYTKIIHVINLTNYEMSLENIERNLLVLNENKDFLIPEIDLARQNLHLLLPQNNRVKRGLINIGGKAIKWLYGNMDSDDAEEIYSHLKNLDENAKQMTSELNKQVVINNEIISNIDKISDHVNKQQSELSEYLVNVTKNTNRAISLSEKFQLTLKIHVDLNLLNRQIEKILDTLLLSRLEVLPHDIFSEKERKLLNISAEKLPFIKSNVLTFGEIMVFAIFVPSFTREIFSKATVIPIPNKQFEELDNPIENVILCNDFVYQSSPETLVKKKLKIHKNNCIRNALKKSNQCKLRINNKTVIEEIDEGIIVTKNLKLTEVKQNCSDENVYVKNNNVIHFKNCSVKIENLFFDNKIIKFIANNVIQTVHVNFSKEINNLTLENLLIENIKNRGEIKYINFKSNVSTGTLSFLLFLTVIFIIFIIFKYVCNQTKKQEIVTKIEMPTFVDPFSSTCKY